MGPATERLRREVRTGAFRLLCEAESPCSAFIRSVLWTVWLLYQGPTEPMRGQIRFEGQDARRH